MACEQQPETSVVLPPDLLNEAQRIATEENWTLGEAVVFLAKRGVKVERLAESALKRSYKRLMNEQDPAKKSGARKNLIKKIFGPDSIAKD